eukprot:12881553-Alexandrium_andersonii.AAC.1
MARDLGQLQQEAPGRIIAARAWLLAARHLGAGVEGLAPWRLPEYGDEICKPENESLPREEAHLSPLT